MQQYSLKGKKLLILAGNDVHMKLVTAARELGIYTIVTDYLPKESSPAKQIADEYWNLSTSDIDLVVQKCLDEHVDGILNFCIDTVQKAYQQLCERLDLPCYGTKEIFETFTNKRLFKDYLKAHGVSVIPEYTLNQVESGKAMFPLLVKPSDSRGSRGITICQTVEELPIAIEFACSESHDGCYLIERYMRGLGMDDMGLAYMVIDGVPYLTKISDRILGYPEDHLQCQQMASILPSKHAAEYMVKVHPKVVDMIKSLHIPFGVIFMQGIWENGDMYMYDPGVRFPGSDFDIVTKEVTGFDSMKAFVEFAVSGNTAACYGDPTLAYNYNGQKCVILAISCRGGKIATFDGVEALKIDVRNISVRQIYHVGETIPSTGDVRQRVLELVSILPDDAAVKSYINDVYNTIQIFDEKGNNMIVSKVKL